MPNASDMEDVLAYAVNKLNEICLIRLAQDDYINSYKLSVAKELAGNALTQIHRDFYAKQF